MPDRIRNLTNRIKNKIENEDQGIAIISYIPLIGWIIASFKSKTKDKFVHFHREQAKEINIGIVVIYIFVWFIENFPLTAWLFGKKSIFYPLTESVWTLILLFYIVITLIGVYKAIHDEIWSYPYRKEINEKIKEFFKKTR